MNKEKYLKQVKRQLLFINKKKREEIFYDISQNIHRFNDADIIGHFGTPKALVHSYLEDMNYELSLMAKLYSYVLKYSKKLFLVFGLIFVGIILTVVIVFNVIDYLSSDSFNYANTSHKNWQTNNTFWQEITTKSVKLTIRQAKIAFRFHDKPTILAKCRGNDVITDNGVSFIEQSKCLAYIPHSIKSIDAIQSDVVIVEPKGGLFIDANQSKIRIAANNNRYRYEIEKQQSSVDDLILDQQSDKIIMIKLYQSMVSPYNNKHHQKHKHRYD